MDFQITKIFNINFLISLIFIAITIDFLNPRIFPGEKVFRIFVFATSFLYLFFSRNNLKFNLPIIFVIFLYSFYLFIGIFRGEAIRNVGAAIVLYGQPILFYLYFISNPEITKKLFLLLVKLKPFFFLIIFFGISYVILSTGELRRYEVRSPILFTLVGLALSKDFNFKNILIMAFLFFICFNSGIRFTLFQIALSFFLTFYFVIRSGQRSFFEISLILFCGLIFLAVFNGIGLDALLETRFRTLVGLSGINFYDLLANNEYSTLTRLLEYSSIVEFIDNKNIFNIIFGHGFGATYPASDELLFLTQLSEGGYSSVIRDNGNIHNIHNGLLSIFFRCGILGILIYLFMVFDAARIALTTRNDYLLIISISFICLVSSDMFYSMLQQTTSYLVIPLYFYARTQSVNDIK